MNTRRSTLKGLAAGALVATGGRAFAQSDSSTVTVLVGAPSSMDFQARAIADHLRDTLGRPVIAVSKLGAGQRVALGEARRAAPDGRTLIFVTTGPLAIHPHVYKKLDYDPDADFTPIIGVSKFDVALAVYPGLGVKSLDELIKWVKSQSDETIFASAPGNGSFSHFTGLAFQRAAGLKLRHVPYKNSGEAIVDVAGGRVPFMITGISPLLPMHKDGKVRIIGVSGPKRSPLVPEVATMSESGLNVSASTTTGLFGPANLPADTVKMYHDAVRPLLSKPEFVDKLRGMGVEMWPATGAELAAETRRERAFFGDLAKEFGFEQI